MKRTLLLSFFSCCIYLHSQVSYVDPCFTEPATGISFASTANLSNVGANSDLCVWTGTTWTGGWPGANLTLAPPVNNNTCRAIWIGSASAWTTGGEGFAIRMTNPMVTGNTYSFKITYVSHGNGSNGSFVPTLHTNSTPTTAGAVLLPSLPPAGYSWTTNILTITASAAQNGHVWIIFGSWPSGSSGFINSFCPACNISPLPVELMSFDVEPSENAVKSTWTTSSEINNEYFLLERSQNAVDFEAVGRIEGAGNSNELLNYTFYDPNYSPGINYYRLKQVDFNGQFSTSEIRSVSMIPKGNIYPNPASEVIFVPEIYEGNSFSAGNTILEIINDMGVVVLTQPFSTSVDIRSLANGSYSLKITAANGPDFVFRFLKN